MGKWIDVQTASAAGLQAYLAPPPSGSGPGIVLCPGPGEVDVSLRARADELAEEGYAVAVPSTGARTLLLDDVVATVEVLRKSGAHTGGMGLIGEGEGAGPALLAALSGHADCVACHGVAGLDDAPRQLQSLAVPMVLHFPAGDPRQPAISEGLGGKRNVEIYVYRDAAPVFYRMGSAGYSRATAGIAYSRTLAILRKTLGPVYDLSALWDAHRACEFELRDADATMKTMVAEPYVNHVPTMTGGVGQHDLHHFYSQHFIPNNPTDTKSTLVSRTVGVDRVVNETVLSFTHDRVIDWLLPGVPPTGRRVEIALIGIITFRGDKLVHEHIYWDQASVLAQVGLLDASRLPVAGAEAAHKVMDPSLPSNALMHRHTARVPGA